MRVYAKLPKILFFRVFPPLRFNIWLFEWCELFKTKQISEFFEDLMKTEQQLLLQTRVIRLYSPKFFGLSSERNFFSNYLMMHIFFEILKFWTFSDFRPLLFSMFSTSYILFHIKHFSIFYVDKKHIRYLLLLSIKKNSSISIKCHQW